jgi:hypothetical protein
VAHLGIGEHRRGRPRFALDKDSGEYVLLADRWHTCLFDLAGDQGLLGQVEGDTGPLVAVAPSNDADHLACVKLFTGLHRLGRSC